MAEQYLIEVSEKLALLIKGTRVNGHDKISINSLYKKGDEWMFGRNNVSFPLDQAGSGRDYQRVKGRPQHLRGVRHTREIH